MKLTLQHSPGEIMKMTISVVSLLLVLGIFSPSQAQTAPVKIPTIEEMRQPPELEEDSLQILTTLPKTQFSGGEEIKLGINLKNVGTKRFVSRYGNDRVDSFFNIKVFAIVGTTQQEIDHLPNGYLFEEGPGFSAWVISPNKSRKGVAWLNNLFDFHVAGKFRVIASKNFLRQGKVITLSSEPLDFEIVSTTPYSRWESYDAD